MISQMIINCSTNENSYLDVQTSKSMNNVTRSQNTVQKAQNDAHKHLKNHQKDCTKLAEKIKENEEKKIHLERHLLQAQKLTNEVYPAELKNREKSIEETSNLKKIALNSEIKRKSDDINKDIELLKVQIKHQNEILETLRKLSDQKSKEIEQQKLNLESLNKKSNNITHDQQKKNSSEESGIYNSTSLYINEIHKEETESTDSDDLEY